MPTGISVHVGLNRVDPIQYEGWDGQLGACEADAKDMRALATAQGFEVVSFLLTDKATSETVTRAIKEAARRLKSGDIFFLTYSGHGGQVKDTNHDEAKGQMDSTWVLFDRQFVDDELYDLWRQFKRGVRILVLSDSCHSGTVVRDVPAFIDGGDRVRAMPREVGKRVERAHATLYREIQIAHPRPAAATVPPSVLLISGCMDNQYSMDGAKNGAFTGMLRKVWANGKFEGHYRRFRDRIVAKLPATQTPNYYVVGAANPVFEAQKPFTI